MTKPIHKFTKWVGILILVQFFAGCATPNYDTVSRTDVISPDASDNLGGTGIESNDVRTIASQMTSSLMTIPEIHRADQPVRIAIAPVRNSTRFMIDTGIFTTRLRAEMNQISQGRVRFFAQDYRFQNQDNRGNGSEWADAQSLREQVLWERDRNQWNEHVDASVRKLLDVIRASGKPLPVKMVALASTTQNVEGIDADSVISMVRARMAQEMDVIRFLSRDADGKITDALLNEAEARDLKLVTGDTGDGFSGADYFLGGELIAESLKERSVGSGQEAPNETMVLNLKLTDARTGIIQGEITLPVKERVTLGIERANFILTGEMRGISKASAGDYSDYILMSFQLIDPVTNELVWEDIYETKKVTSSGVLYK